MERDNEELLIRDKYEGDRGADLTEDLARLAAGEPLAYVIGWIPFQGLRVGLSSRPLIPRPETEYWTGELITHLRKKFGNAPFTLLDLCAGSGAVGLAVLKEFPLAQVSFGEFERAHVEEIRRNIQMNGLDAERVTVRCGNLFAPFFDERFDVIACNPPYIPSGRTLDASVIEYEPSVALYSGPDGLTLIRRIAGEASRHLNPTGELWMECDVDNIEEARQLVADGGAVRCDIRTDHYGRPRFVVGYYP